MDGNPTRVPMSALDEIVGVSEWTSCIRDEILCVARHTSSVLITGSSGTGKELIARGIHENGPRADKPFIPVDCAAVTSSLFGSHMFGHLKGAFSGATYPAMGCFRAADLGTIFLDEIGELEPDMQAKLLRVLQQRTVVPVGSHAEVSVDVRVIAATNRNLEEESAEGRFREDLLFRLNVVSLKTVPLHRRPEDIEVLAEYILAKLTVRSGLPLKRISREALQLLHRYHWPGNVRELENILERAVLFAKNEVLWTGDMPHLVDAISQPRSEEQSPQRRQRASLEPREAPAIQSLTQKWRTLDDVDREHICMTLEQTEYNQSEAARLLKMDRQMLRRKMTKLRIPFSRSQRGRPRMLPR